MIVILSNLYFHTSIIKIIILRPNYHILTLILSHSNSYTSTLTIIFISFTLTMKLSHLQQHTQTWYLTLYNSHYGINNVMHRLTQSYSHFTLSKLYYHSYYHCIYTFNSMLTYLQVHTNNLILTLRPKYSLTYSLILIF